jgi:peptide/nickel transport system permease protein
MNELAVAPQTAPVATTDPAKAKVSQAALLWGRFKRHRSGVVALAVLLLLVVSVVLVPLFLPFDLSSPNPLEVYAPVGTVDNFNFQGATHWLGTDYLGRDIMMRLFVGARVSLLVALLSSISIVVIGSILGAVSGFYGGWTDTIMMRFTDFLLALPLLPLFLFALRLLKEAPALRLYWRNAETNTFITIAAITGIFTLFGWMGVARLVRSSILSLRSQSFIESARALGATNRRIIFKHLLPNTLAPILVAATFAVGDFIILEAILAYFNQGINDPPLPSLGNMLASAQPLALNIVNLNPFQDIRGYIFLLPGLMVLIAVLSINYVGDALRSALDPHES